MGGGGGPGAWVASAACFWMQGIVFAAAGKIVADVSQDPLDRCLSAMGREEGKEEGWV